MREASGDATADELNRGSYTLQFQIRTNGLMGPNAVANEALSASPHPLPSLWSTYSYQGSVDLLSFARSYQVTHHPGRSDLWYITVNYQPPEPGEWAIGGSEPIKAEPVPWERATVIWWDREVYTKNMDFDKDGEPVINKCRTLYPDAIEHDKPRGVLVIEFNVATLAEVIAISKEYDQAVNETTWIVPSVVSAPARTALCREVASGPPQAEHGYSFFHVAMRIVFADEGANWDDGQLEIGDYHWRYEAGSYLLDSEGFRRRFSPGGGGLVLLAENGTRLADDADPIKTFWRIRREVNFNLIPI